ncbi:MAG TPA: SMP-30/gluconolactonase/LRE family protein [Alphaproteobacteria bacterium]|nr:SMP-30/gluconolactonase/LRE family protein [Alphaproteobacteria bacterium]
MTGEAVLYEHYEKEFRRLINGSAQLETLYTSCRWAEGPVWFGDGNYLLWSDIPNDRILRWTRETGVSVFRTPAGNTNGHTRDREGRLISCSHGNRRVERTEHDGRITVLADRYNGKRLNSPNDVVVKSDGTIWFTDPAYGIETDYEGNKGPQEQDGCYVYCLDPRTGKLKVVVDDFDRPNGLAFSPDESILYIADSAASHGPDRPHHVRAFRVGAGNRLSGGKVFKVIEPGIPDGLRVDTEGNIWVTAERCVQVLSPSAVVIGRINLPKTPANLTFGGPKKNWLFIAATDSVHLLHTMANGVQTP